MRQNGKINDSRMKLGILKETKTPPDRRVPFTPAQCLEMQRHFKDLDVVVQPSDMRCFGNDEYENIGLNLQEDLSDCQVLMGVKEVDIPSLIEGKTYLFFSHTAKEQPYNRGLLKEIVRKGITLIDYEYLTLPDRTRVVAFGRWAGIVGAYNGLMAYCKRQGNCLLPPANTMSGLAEMKLFLDDQAIGQVRILLTGGGRVAGGAMEILRAARIREITPDEYLSIDFNEPVFCRLDPWHYTRHRAGREFLFKHFMEHPEEYENAILPYAMRTDLFMACHFWDPESPVMLTRDHMRDPAFPIRVIADISCDMNGPIASTIRPSTIAEPFYGYDPETGKESKQVFGDNVITVMAVDNLPGELPRDASRDFGDALIENVMPYLVGEDEEGIIARATIVKEGRLTPQFAYLKRYLATAD
jgi:alanine dehydrogenase